MVAASASRPVKPVHPVQIVLLTSPFPLFLAGLLADIAYARTSEIQWTNFAAWLIAGAMVFTGLAFAGSLFETVRGSLRGRRALVSLLLLAATFIVGLMNSFMHARDAWGSMPSAVVLSLIATALAAAAIWVGALAARTGAAS